MTRALDQLSSVYTDGRSSCPLHQGSIDVEKEVAKLSTKKGELEKQMEKVEEKMKKSDYREKVPAKVQEQDAEKVSLLYTYTFILLAILTAVLWRWITFFFFFILSLTLQLRQSQTELQKVTEAIENFRRMM